MNWSSINLPLGMGNSFSSVKKEWVQIALAAAGLASSLIGGAASASAARKAERRQRQQEAEENAWYRRRYNENYVDTAAGQNLVRRAKDYARENWKKAQGAAKVGGATEAASAMAKEAGNKMVGNTIADIAANDTARKDRVDNMHRQARQNFANMDIQREYQRAENIKEAAQGASNAMMSAAGYLDGKVNLTGGSNMSTTYKNNATAANAASAAESMRKTASADLGKLWDEQYRNTLSKNV